MWLVVYSALELHIQAYTGEAFPGSDSNDRQGNGYIN